MALFLTLTYGIGLALFALPLLGNTGLGVIDLELPGVAPFVLLSAFSLPIAAYLVTRLAGGRGAGREFGGRVFHLRVNPAWYVAALILLPAIGLATTVVLEGTGVISALADSPTVLLDALLIGGLSAFLLVNWWEEAGWTGFALHRLQPRFGPVVSSILTTWMQATLHLPLVFVAGGVTDGRVPANEIPMYLAAIYILPISVRLIITWIYNASGRSVPVVGLYHAGLGVATGSGFLPVIAPGMNTLFVYAGFAVVAAVLLVTTRGRLGYGPAQPTESLAPATAS